MNGQNNQPTDIKRLVAMFQELDSQGQDEIFHNVKKLLAQQTKEKSHQEQP